MIAGSALGGVLGSAIGNGSGRRLATVGGALVGGFAGNVVENKMDSRDGLAITVQMDNGEERVIAQEADVPVVVGQRVQVVSGNGPVRVHPYR